MQLYLDFFYQVKFKSGFWESILQNQTKEIFVVKILKVKFDM